jgi:hypothetical protein
LKYLSILLGGLLLLMPLAMVTARPVSYPGGWTGMLKNDMDRHSLHLHYSPSARHSLGLYNEYRRDKDYVFTGGQLNFLVKRWNKPDSQANFYLKTGLGVAYSDFRRFDNDIEPSAFTGIAADWETRRWFTSYANRLFTAGDFDQYFMQQARVGVAPYIGGYGDIHTWLMLQVNHDPSNENDWAVTPLVRVFKDVHLVEAGISHRGDILFNYVIRY